METLKGTIQKIYDFQEGIENVFFDLDGEGLYELPNPEERKRLKVLKKCPLDGQPINYIEGSGDESYESAYESFDHLPPSPCNGCFCLTLVSDVHEDYGVVGICKRYCEFDPNKVTLIRWMVAQ